MDKFEKKLFPDLGDSPDDSEKELAVFGGELDYFKGDILAHINRQQDVKDKKEAELALDSLEDNSSDTDFQKVKKISSQSIPFSIPKTIEDKIGNENPLANQGRVESYTNVSDFSQQVVQQGGIFGKIVNRLS